MPCTTHCACLGSCRSTRRPRGRAIRRRSAAGSPSWRHRGARSGCASPHRTAGSRSRTPRGSATPSARPCRQACRRRSWNRSTIRLAISSAAGLERTGRSCRTSQHAVSAWASRWWPTRSPGWRWPGGWSRASSARVGPGGNGSTPRCCGGCGAARWPRSARKWSRSPRTRWPASCWPGRGSARLVRDAPASALERQVLPGRLPEYSPGLLDQLCAAGEVVWVGAGPLGSDDGWVSLYLADQAPLLLPEPLPVELSPLAIAVRDALAGHGAMFFRQLSDAVGSTNDTELLLAIWELVWAGLVTNDTMAPLRGLLAGGVRSAGGTARSRRTGRPRRPALPSRLGPPAGAGRWSLAPERSSDGTRRLHAAAEQLLERHGVVTRGAVIAERVSGGFAGVYPVLKAMEEAGRCRRGYFVDALGAAQFAVTGAVDRMRSLADRASAQDRREPQTVVLAAADPANPYGAALSWPERSATAADGQPAA